VFFLLVFYITYQDKLRGCGKHELKMTSLNQSEVNKIPDATCSRSFPLSWHAMCMCKLLYCTLYTQFNL